MLKSKSFYVTLIGMYAVIAVPNMMFQMRADKKMFQEIPVAFFGAILVAALICTFVIHKILMKQSQ